MKKVVEIDTAPQAPLMINPPQSKAPTKPSVIVPIPTFNRDVVCLSLPAPLISLIIEVKTEPGLHPEAEYLALRGLAYDEKE